MHALRAHLHHLQFVLLCIYNLRNLVLKAWYLFFNWLISPEIDSIVGGALLLLYMSGIFVPQDTKVYLSVNNAIKFPSISLF